MLEILEILQKNSKFTSEEISVMTGRELKEVKEIIERAERENIIVGYTTLINWEKTTNENVTALIEVKITPQRGAGFDKVAQRIYKFSEVQSCYLMSGGFDLTVVIEGKTMKEVALFVAEKLAVQDYVLSTSTHFVLKKYKDKGVIFEKNATGKREDIFI